MKRTMLAVVIAWGCGGNAKNTPAPAPEPEVAPEPAPAPEVATPQALYEECRDRVEGPQAEGECQTDADCKATGCGSEVCTTVAEAANVMTTCEDKPCFQVLDACGCHEGQCTWTVKAELPAAAPAPDGPKPGNSLPSSLPPTKGQDPG